MTNTVFQSSSVSMPGGKAIARIVAIACLTGFLVDMLILGSPLGLTAQWRANFLQQMSERSIVLLFGSALLIYSSLELRKLRRQIGLACLVVGVVFLLSSVLVIRDSLSLNEQTSKAIDTQVSEVQKRIDAVKADASKAPQIKPEQLEQATQAIQAQSVTAKQGAQQNFLKAAMVTVGNLLVTGIALIGLGRYSMKLQKVQGR